MRSLIAVAAAALCVAACEVRPLYQARVVPVAPAPVYQSRVVEVAGDYYYPPKCYEFECARRVVVVGGRRGYYIGPRFYTYAGPVYYHSHGPWRRPVWVYG
ncbi:hypothetical protein K2Q08_02150 [Patescibacteria group bacterium]|nr:hypothetical protein [Patescibacteria group bacterium]